MRADCHMHMILDGIQWRSAIARHADRPDLAFIHSVLSRYRDLGFTYLRDGGDRWGAGKAARDLAPRYGITYRTPLAPLCKKGHYGSFIGLTYSDMAEYAALVRQHRQDGADFIKIMISGLMDFDRFGVLTEDGLPPAQIHELIHIAHEEGFSVMAHCNGAATAIAAAQARVDSIDHGAYLNHEALCAMKERCGLGTHPFHRGQPAGQGPVRRSRRLRHFGKRAGKGPCLCRHGRFDRTRHRRRRMGCSPRQPDRIRPSVRHRPGPRHGSHQATILKQTPCG